MNFKSIIKKQEDGTIDFTISIPWSLILKTKDEVLDEHAKDAEIPGFRKGMAPKSKVEQTLSQDHIREDVLRRILPQAYSETIKEHKIIPIISPRILVQKLEDNADWQFHALTCEMPKITLGNYKPDVKAVTAKGKIVVPGKPDQPVGFDEIARTLLEKVKFTVPSVILDNEVEKQLSQTLDEVKKLGLTLDQYLSSTGRTIDSLKAEYAKKAENDVRLEFILQEIAKEENIKVEESEINEAVATAKSDAERQNLESNRYLLASIIRQQKTLDFLRSL
jgi:FKBP-type peptidyl-prolyl cis-trans isomerase (trigger factor)